MGRLQEAFNDIFSMDRIKGAAMGASAGYVLTAGNPVGALLLGITGAMMGAESLKETFQSAVMGREMALSTVPALAKRVLSR